MAETAALLEREVYTEAEAARLLAIPQNTLHSWLEGGRSYPPILRETATRSRVVTWGEFVEAGLLRQHLQTRVPMPQLRAFFQRLREEMAVACPLAHQRPWFLRRDLLREAQDSSGLRSDFWLVASDQLLLTFPGGSFLRRVNWDEAAGVVAGHRPQDDQESPVVIDPLVRFGRPSIKGVGTEAIAAEVDAGASPVEVAADFGLRLADVRSAFAFEATRAA